MTKAYSRLGRPTRLLRGPRNWAMEPSIAMLFMVLLPSLGYAGFFDARRSWGELCEGRAKIKSPGNSGAWGVRIGRNVNYLAFVTGAKFVATHFYEGGPPKPKKEAARATTQSPWSKAWTMRAISTFAKWSRRLMPSRKARLRSGDGRRGFRLLNPARALPGQRNPGVRGARDRPAPR